MKDRNKPKAIFYANSQLLFGGYKALHSMNLHIPADVAVVSFDQPLIIDALTPRPTTLKKVEKQIALTAARILHAKFDGDESNPPQIIRIYEHVCRR